jgi:predicted amidohydrolase
MADGALSNSPTPAGPPAAPWRIGLAALRPAGSTPAGVERMRQALAEGAERGARLVCFPEAYLPGLRGTREPLPAPDQEAQAAALDALRAACREHAVAAIAGMEWLTERGLENRAVVIASDGAVLGHQTKNQITPGGESAHYVPDGRRRLFRIDDLVFGVAICHEAWRYPETVRWAAVRGAQVVFQPQMTGSDAPGRGRAGAKRGGRWGASFYEKAMECRAQENSIYFASVNFALRAQNSATSLLDPHGRLVAHLPYGEEGLLVADLDLAQATRYYASRYNPAWYPAEPPAEDPVARAAPARPVVAAGAGGRRAAR